MAEHSSRPFYGEYAWAFDLLIDRPVSQDSAAIHGAEFIIDGGTVRTV